MIEKNSQTAKVRKGLSARRNVESFQTMQDIIIPAGTLLRGTGDDKFVAGVGFGGIAGEFSITVKPGAVVPAEAAKRVISS